LEITDYTDFKKPVKSKDYQAQLLSDPEPIVRAAVWSNPQCRCLPWKPIFLSESWKTEFRTMSQPERLGMMRNPALSYRFVVALLETPSSELEMSTGDHVDILVAAAVNPNLIGASRRTGRKNWKGFDWDEPIEEYGIMWDLCLDRWAEEHRVPYYFFKYVQTTPAKKLATYQKLNEKNDDKEFAALRCAIIGSCDPITDVNVLRLGLEDRDEECRKAAGQRVGSYSQYVGVKTSV